MLGIFPKGWRVPLSFRREGKRYDVNVRLAGLHSNEELLEKTSGRPPDAGRCPSPSPAAISKAGTARPRRRRPKPRKCPLPDDWARSSVPRRPPARDRQEAYSRRSPATPTTISTSSNQNRVWKAWAAKADVGRLATGPGPSPVWPKAAGSSLRAERRRRPDEASQRRVKWEAGPTLASSLLPAGSGGLLPALYLWRRLALDGPEHFGQVEYLGTAPLPGHEGLVDVLTASHKGVEMLVLLSIPAGGQLLAMEMYPRRTPILARSISPTITRWTGVSCRGGWKSASPTSGSACLPSSILPLPRAGRNRMIRAARHGIVILAALAAAAACTAGLAGEDLRAETIVQAQAKMVKIYGAGGFRGLEAYQSGVLISDQGTFSPSSATPWTPTTSRRRSPTGGDSRPSCWAPTRGWTWPC